MAWLVLSLPCSRANGKLLVSTCLEERPRVSIQEGRHVAVSMRSESLFCSIVKQVPFSGHLGPSGVHHYPPGPLSTSRPLWAC